MKRVFLDEGVPKRLAATLRANGIDAVSFPNEWKQLADGDLLSRLEGAGFDVLLTNDKKMQFQQKLSDRNLAILVLPTNRFPDVIELVPAILQAVARCSAGRAEAIGLTNVGVSR